MLRKADEKYLVMQRLSHLGPYLAGTWLVCVKRSVWRVSHHSHTMWICKSIGGTFASLFVENWHRFSHIWFIFLCISSKYIPAISLNTYCCSQNDNKVLSFMSPIIWHLHDIVDYNLFPQEINRHRCLLLSLFLRSRTAHQELHQVHETWNMEDPPVPIPLTYQLLFKYCMLALFSSR